MAEHINKKRPVYISVTEYRFPITAIASISHRITGVIIFLYLPFLLYFLQQSLMSQRSFLAVVQQMHQPLVQFFSWVLLSVVFFHLLTGIRHIMMDSGIGESLKAGKITATTAFVLAGLFALILGVWLIW